MYCEIGEIIFVQMTFIAPHFQKAKKRSAFSFFRKDRFLVKTPWWLKKLYTGCVWDMPVREKVLYLSFDDGPHPSITPYVLAELKKYNARATFFCIGNNVVKYPEVYNQYLIEGHAVGNHTQHHLNGWITSDEQYLQDIAEARKYIHSNLFRPPYGRISRSQIRLLQKKTPYQKIIMWNILAGDWVQELSPERCYQRMKSRICDGDIIVLHESEKAWDRMTYCLPRLLKEYSKLGYSFLPIT